MESVISMTTEKMLEIAANALNEKKALDLSAIKVGDLTVITEYFLMTSATSSTHVRALAEEVEDKLSKEGVEPLRIEGRGTNWVLLDYGAIIVHVFTKDAREFYNLDRIWNDGEHVELSEILTNSEEGSN